MTQPPDDETGTPDFLAKPVSPSGDQGLPSSPEPPTNPYTASPPPPSGHPYGYGAPPPVAPGPEQGYTSYASYSPYPAPPSPYAPPPGTPYLFGQPHGGASTAMGLGITSLVCAVLTPFCCITLVGVLCGPFAIVLGARARTEMRRNPGLYSNEGAATTGFVTGIIGTVIGVLAFVAVAVFFGFVIGTG